jgi:glycosyltransferase involved in cell wall biosynthesis
MSAVPRVSILLPALNAEATLPACLRSIERQSLRDWECVIVDDGSTDGTGPLLHEVARRDPRFRLSSGPHRGLVAALNTGLAACRADLVARMDADDLMHRRRLELQVAALTTRPDRTAVGCHIRMFPRASVGAGYREYEAWLGGIDSAEAVRREAFIECPVVHPTLVLRRSRLVSLGYRDLGWPEDYDLVLRLLTAGDEIGVVPRRLLSWRHRTDRLSLSSPNYDTDRFTACKARFLADSFLSDSPRYILWGYGGTGRALRRALEATGHRPSYIIEVHRGRLGNRIHGAPVVPPSALPDLPRHPLLVSVAGRGPRSHIRRTLAAMGFTESRDYICTA